MPNRYPHFMGGSQKCTQGAPPVKARNCKSMKMLNCILAWILVPAARTMQTAVDQVYYKTVSRLATFDSKPAQYHDMRVKA